MSSFKVMMSSFKVIMSSFKVMMSSFKVKCKSKAFTPAFSTFQGTLLCQVLRLSCQVLLTGAPYYVKFYLLGPLIMSSFKVVF